MPKYGTVFATSAFGGQPSKCCNCGTTTTPLWRKGKDDELNCNACGIYFKVVCPFAHVFSLSELFSA
ncbi:hypothetical protein GYMLUDRAFT_177022 [Collybiopsis luxurians FD-317 M1]|uniref:GATA-type domain-containing protein n=1 Tax=Collybiopsis luxurians FD-317 M1 TaxID=944289 RepID=A0A0D0CHY4_9AGAR|nr:hypothetical protein GYMLUDRAFT_177022 [Collybiopsis luxurians FD-317 M1]